MFIKKSWSIYKGKKSVTYEIAESYRPGKGQNPRTRKIANISQLPLRIIDRMALLLKYPNAQIITNINNLYQTSVVLGPLLIIYLLMRRLGIISALQVIPRVSRILLLGVIINRIMAPRSKLGSVSWLQHTAFHLIFGLAQKSMHVNQIYRAMDALYDRIDTIMATFFQKNKQGTSLILYDITSIFFEGAGPIDLAANGYSRDKRPDRPQIILCLCVNEQRLPIFFEVLAGNITDKTTVIPLITKLKEQFAIAESIFIGDRGMISKPNKEFMEKEDNLDYILALTHSQARTLLHEQYPQQLDLFQEELPLTIYDEEEEIEDAAGHKRLLRRSYILCGSPYRREHDLKLFDKILKKGQKALEVVQKMVATRRLKDHDKVIRRAQKKLTQTNTQNYYDFTYEDGIFTIIRKEATIAVARKLCGHYVLQTTDTTKAPRTIEENYKLLKIVENIFRDIKDWIEIRPVFHYTERRVKSHIFLCILAQTVASTIRDVLKQKGWLRAEIENSCKHFFDIMAEIRLGTFQIEEKEHHAITNLTDEQKKFITLFQLKSGLFSNLKMIMTECRQR